MSKYLSNKLHSFGSKGNVTGAAGVGTEKRYNCRSLDGEKVQLPELDGEKVQLPELGRRKGTTAGVKTEKRYSSLS